MKSKNLSCVFALASVALALSSCGSGNEENNQPDKHEHNLTLVSEVAASCTHEGMKEHYTCDGCDLLFDADKNETTSADLTIQKTAHNYGSPVIEWVDEHTHNEMRSTISCQNVGCNESKSEVKSAVRGADNPAPTCTTDGKAVYEATFSEEFGGKQSLKVNLPATGHSFASEWSKDENYHWHAATCEHTTEIDAKAEHTWDSGEITTQPGCETDGVITYTCTVCDATKTETIDPTGHTYAKDWSKNDTHHWHAATCGHDLKQDYEEHAWDEGQVTTPATCTSDGVRTYTCGTCGATKTEVIVQTGHEAKTAWETSAEKHWHECAHDDCDAKLEEADHSFVVVPGEHVDPTCTSKGTEVYECSVCGYKKSEEIAMNAHDYQDKSSTAFKFEESATWKECSVCKDVKDYVKTEDAPWIDQSAGLDSEELNAWYSSLVNSVSEYDKDTHTMITGGISDEGAAIGDLLCVAVDSEAVQGKKYVSMEVTMDKGTNGWADFMFGINHNVPGKISSRGYAHALVLEGTQTWENYAPELSIIDVATGASLKGGSIMNKKVELTFNISGATEPIKNVYFGTSLNDCTITVHSITFKDTLCGHTLSQIGTVQGVDTPYKYDFGGSYEACTECGLVIDETNKIEAPWVNVLPTNSNQIVKGNNFTAGNFDPATKTFTSTDACYLGFNVNPSALTGKKYLSITLTANRNTGASWGPDLYLMVNRNASTTQSDLKTRVYTPNPLNNSWGSEVVLPGETITDPETGAALNGVNCFQGKKFTITIDVSSVEAINNVWFGSDCPAIFVIDDITFKDTLCGHQASDLQTIQGAEKAFKYDFGGSYVACKECGKIHDDSQTTPAPWVKVPFTAFSKLSQSTNTGYNNTLVENDQGLKYTGYYNGGAVADNLQEYSTGRNIISITIKPSKCSWGTNFYLRVHKLDMQDSHLLLPVNQFYSGTLANFINAGGKIYNEAGQEVSAIDNTHFFTFEYDCSSKLGAGEAIKSVTVWSGWDSDDSGTDYANAELASFTIKDLTFKSSFCGCVESTPEEVHTGSVCGTQCSGCGALLSNMINSMQKAAPAAHTDAFSYETGVTFDGKANCLKTHSAELENTDAMGWLTNYKVYLKGLVANARASGKTLISFMVYVDGPRTDNMRFTWGVGNNASMAQADHWNDPCLLQGTTNVATNSTITDVGGSAAKLVGKQWRIITVDVSDDYYADYADFALGACFDSSNESSTIDAYITNITCTAPQA